ncbi:DUF1877 family protein [Gemmatimonas groenlandica]|uniref:DUF1877 family protein n=1 Tax=Gemmatimonas groenlandica TaxID=2732249 RepID=A0A6M4IS78_9BACT|nr:DUF1877 family protein [Gemmatimonas groenlandica]
MRWWKARTGLEEIGDVDVGYGSARGLRPRLVTEIAAKPTELSDAALSARFDGPATRAKEISPDIGERDSEEDDARAYLPENLVGLRTAVSAAASRQLGLVVLLRQRAAVTRVHCSSTPTTMVRRLKNGRTASRRCQRAS